jgi:hypothetical protein
MTFRARLLIALLGVCLARVGFASAALSLTDWSLTTAVQNLSGEPLQNVDFFLGVQGPPFTAAHSAALGAGTAATSYDFSWFGNNASFRIDGQHVATDLGNALNASLSTGFIYFTTTDPVVARVMGAYTYSLPVFDMYAQMNFGIIDSQSFEVFLNDAHDASTLLNPWPLNGTLLADRAVTLPGGRSYTLSYYLALQNHRNSGALSTGQGFALITFQPVPEPTALALLSAAAVLIRRR